jgi:hypothetical protein
MLRLKIFSSAGYGGDIGALEEAINTWLVGARPSIRHVVQSNPSEEALVITFLYEDGQLETNTRKASAAMPETFERGLNEAEPDLADDEPTLLPDAELPY